MKHFFFIQRALPSIYASVTHRQPIKQHLPSQAALGQRPPGVGLATPSSQPIHTCGPISRCDLLALPSTPQSVCWPHFQTYDTTLRINASVNTYLLHLQKPHEHCELSITDNIYFTLLTGAGKWYWEVARIALYRPRRVWHHTDLLNCQFQSGEVL